AAAEARARVRRGADVPHARHVGAVRSPPQEALVELERAAVRVAADEVDVRRLQVGRGEADALQDRALEVRYVPRDPGLDPVGVALAELLRPGAVAHVELAGRVALHVPGKLLQLDPEEALPCRGARRVERQRLADDD